MREGQHGAPKCPYCGEEMGGGGDDIFGYNYTCTFCGSSSPQRATLEAAHAAAMKRECPKAKNIGTDFGEQDQFICSECGIHLQDWVRIDEDDYEDGIVHEYVFRFCPNCGRRIDDEP